MWIPSNNFSTKNHIIVPPNDEAWYISYLPPSSTYSNQATTSLVVGQMQRFYILKGDFRDQYKKLIAKGFRACYNFFCKNSHLVHQYSDKILPVIDLEKIMADYSNFLSSTHEKSK